MRSAASINWSADFDRLQDISITVVIKVKVKVKVQFCCG